MSYLKINGGYAKVQKFLFAVELRDESNGALVDFAYATDRNQAARYVSKKGLRINHIWDEIEMGADLLEQAKDWLRGR
jgi:hypothetical protein